MGSLLSVRTVQLGSEELVAPYVADVMCATVASKVTIPAEVEEPQILLSQAEAQALQLAIGKFQIGSREHTILCG